MDPGIGTVPIRDRSGINNGKRVKTEYLSNTADGELSCRWYRTTDTRGNVQVSIQSGKVYYPAGELYVTRTTDEEGTG